MGLTCLCCRRKSKTIPITNDAIPPQTKTPGTFIQKEVNKLIEMSLKTEFLI